MKQLNNKEISNSLNNMKFFVHTFGCQMNENDSERITGILKDAGAQLAASPQDSDLVIINTCAVREKSEEKLYSYLGRLKRLKKEKNIAIGVAGCVAQLYKDDLIKEKPYINFVVGPDNYWRIPHFLKYEFNGKNIAVSWNRQWKNYSTLSFERESTFSAYVTIMKGCNNFCSYCIVPYTRGREKYRPMRNIFQEVKDLASNGFKEIQLLGQNVNSYKDPDSGKDFSFLLNLVSQVDGIKWIRFISSHPKNFTEKIIDTMAKTDKICSQVHLPVQSGSSSILKSMNRKYSREDYLELIEIIKKKIPHISLSTDIIVGYPGETEDDFNQTMSLLKAVRFHNIFSFRYSPRPLTSASKLKDTVPFEVKKNRLMKLQNYQKKIQCEINNSMKGKTMKVLCTGRSKRNNFYSGRNEAHQVVNFQSHRDVYGQWVEVRITSFGPYSLFGVARDEL